VSAGAFVDGARSGLPLEEADFVVVGSGAGGGAAARILAASGARVVVLEEGPRLRAEELGVSEGASRNRLFRNQGKQAAFGRATTPFLQGRCVGGTTFVNSAIVWRLPPKVLERWHREFGLADGLPQAALDAAAARVEEELSVRPVTEGDTAGKSDLLLRAAAREVGIEGRFMHRYERGCRGSGRCFHGCPHEAKQSTAVSSLRRAVADGGYVVADARVERIERDGGRAVAVRGFFGGDGPERGQRFRVAARRAVVVAGGVVQSSNLLWRSGVRSAHLGRHFMAHPGTAMMGLYEARVDAWTGASQGYEVFGLRDTLGVKFETINIPPEVTAARLPGAGARFAQRLEQLPHVANWAVALKAEAEGRIRPSLLFGDLVRYDLTRSDVERLRGAMRRLAEMHFVAGAREVVTGVAGLPETIRSRDELALFDQAPLDARAYSLVMTHLFGGCRAGKDASSSVVDPTLKVHGVDGLYVMDASVFPTNTGVNPQHSIMSVATVAATRLVS
jgi:choline dehydrogenase-like flavoprotein